MKNYQTNWKIEQPSLKDDIIYSLKWVAIILAIILPFLVLSSLGN